MQKIKDLIYFNKKEIITVISCLVIFFSIFLFQNNDDNYDVKKNYDLEIEKKEEQNVEEKIVIDIKGEIINPGTYELTSNDRINDAIIKAGGLTNNADTNNINLSEKLVDEMLIIVPSKTKENIEMKEENNTIALEKDESLDKNNSTINEITTKSSIQNNVSNKTKIAITKDNKVSINTASVNELTSIKGIGEVKAKKIVEYRTNNGLFKTIEDITKVSGIGNSTFEKIKDYIKV